MTRLLPPSALLLAALLPAGCVYLADDDPCADAPDLGGAIAALELRDPETGTCVVWGSGGGGGGGGGSCGDWGGDRLAEPAAEAAAEPPPDWATCYAGCEGLDEATCLDTPACRAAYVSDCPEGADCTEAQVSFYECWGTAPSGPVQGSCEGLDALACSRHDDCVAHHAAAGSLRGAEEPAPDLRQAIGAFEACAAEPGEPTGPGTCYGEVACDAPEPACPPDSIPGRADGCYTGYCIPVAYCEAPPSCAALDEPSCIGHADCSPLYEGVGCSCDSSGCQCDEWVYDDCAST